jgi:2-oxoglutarate ferredoxin oxidoreductase subunit alpha
MAQYSEKPEDYKNLVDRLRRKIEGSKEHLPQPVLDDTGSKRGILAFGSSDPAVKEARDRMKTEAGMETTYLRLRALPFSAAVDAFVASMDVVYVVEQNRDGQMAALLKEFYPQVATKFRSVLHYNGMALDAQTILDQIAAFEK